MVLADYVQLAPDRRVEYDLNDVQTNETITITVRGPVGFRFERLTVMLVISQGVTRAGTADDSAGRNLATRQR